MQAIREWIHNEVLLYSTGNYIQYFLINHSGKGYEEFYTYPYIHIYIYIYIYIYNYSKVIVYMNHFAVPQKLIQHCKSTMCACMLTSV